LFSATRGNGWLDFTGGFGWGVLMGTQPGVLKPKKLFLHIVFIYQHFISTLSAQYFSMNFLCFGFVMYYFLIFFNFKKNNGRSQVFQSVVCLVLLTRTTIKATAKIRDGNPVTRGAAGDQLPARREASSRLGPPRRRPTPSDPFGGSR